MEKNYIEPNMLIGDIVTQYPESIEILMEAGMHCLGCPASQAESLADACAVHGLDPDPVIEALNIKLTQSRK